MEKKIDIVFNSPLNPPKGDLATLSVKAMRKNFHKSPHTATPFGGLGAQKPVT